MTHSARIAYLLDYFLSENPEHQNIAVPSDEEGQKHILRGLVNQRPPLPINPEILAMEDAYLQEELQGKVVDFSSLSPVKDNLYLWQGDITTLAVDAIVNAANSDMIGCFHPCHSCIDNIIHTKAGIQLRLDCQELMDRFGRPEATGNAKITSAYNLPSQYVIHTVGPIVHGKLELYHQDALERCYRSCLSVAMEEKIQSIAFCCISTGEYHFPQKEACDIAVDTVTSFLKEHNSSMNVIFNVFKDEDLKLYEKKLS